ncbi:MAG: L,D-transpeptidase family protein [Myxococcota bacterium]
MSSTVRVLSTLLIASSFTAGISLLVHRWCWADEPTRPRTVDQVTTHYSPDVKRHFDARLKRHQITWPPQRLQLLAFKEERRLEVWVANRRGSWVHLTDYPILAASGRAGPKRKEGDLQVPEGFYDLPILNPNSRFHLSIRVDYPNAEDIAHATVPRGNMGGDIYIHGSNVSIGCIAIGNPAINQLFTLAALAQTRHIIIAPRDLRTRVAPTTTDPWIRDLYQRLQARLTDSFTRP